MGRIDEGELEFEGLNELEVGMPNLRQQKIRYRTKEWIVIVCACSEVDKHIVPRLLLTASHIETDGNHVQALSPFCKFVLHGECVHSSSGQNDDF
jgi:hypothetical protein